MNRLLVALLALSCVRNKTLGEDQLVPADAGSPSDVAIADAAAPDAAPDLPALRPEAAAPDLAEITDHWSYFLRLHDDLETLLAARDRECLEAPAPYQHRYRDTFGLDTLHLSFRLGLLGVDPAAATACLAAVKAASCDDIAAMGADDADSRPRRWRVPAFEACARIKQPRVATGKQCLSPYDCAPGDQCDPTGPCPARCNMTCAPVCRPDAFVAAAGAECDARHCVAGTVCRQDAAAPGRPAVCAVPVRDGAACLENDDCQPGSFCTRTTAQKMPGLCARVRLGMPCNGSWACPRNLTCLGGTCRPGKGAGQPCTVQGKDLFEGTFTDCNYRMQCLDLDGAGPRCVVGHRLGERCAGIPLPAGGTAGVDCIEGFCDITMGQDHGVCRRHQLEGEPCRDHRQCLPLLECRGFPPTTTCTAVPQARALGAACAGYDSECADGAYCHFDDPNHPVFPGQCRRWKHEGESCAGPGERCDYLTLCVEGICTRC